MRFNLFNFLAVKRWQMGIDGHILLDAPCNEVSQKKNRLKKGQIKLMEKRRKIGKSRYMDPIPDYRSRSFQKNHGQHVQCPESAMVEDENIVTVLSNLPVVLLLIKIEKFKIDAIVVVI